MTTPDPMPGAMPTLRSAGAVSDGVSDNAAVIQHAIDAAAARGGGRVTIPAGGVFLSGGLQLKPRVELHLEPGAVLRASPTIAAHCSLGEIGGNFIAGLRPGERHEARCFIHARDAPGLAITGTGTIDGNARAFVTGDDGQIYRVTPDRPRLMFLEHCDDLVVRDITIRDAAMWTIHPVGCTNVEIDGVKIFNDLKMPNCDGIDPDHCRNVRIAHCHIEAGDDCIVFKNHRAFTAYGPCENIVVTDCTLVSTSCAVKIGSEGHGDFRNITVSDCVIDRSNRGLGIQLRDWGNVEGVLFSNIVIRTRLFGPLWWGKAEPIAITAFPRCKGDRIGSIRNVRFQNIVAEGEGGVFVLAAEGAVIDDLAFDRVMITLRKTTGHAPGWRDLRPQGGEEHRGSEPSHLSGFLLENLGRVELTDCAVTWERGAAAPKAWRHALEAQTVRRLELRRFRGEAASPTFAPIELRDTRMS